MAKTEIYYYAYFLPKALKIGQVGRKFMDFFNLPEPVKYQNRGYSKQI